LQVPLFVNTASKWQTALMQLTANGQVRVAVPCCGSSAWHCTSHDVMESFRLPQHGTQHELTVAVNCISAFAILMPYYEQGNLQNLFDFRVNHNDAKNIPAAGTTLQDPVLSFASLTDEEWKLCGQRLCE